MLKLRRVTEQSIEIGSSLTPTSAHRAWVRVRGPWGGMQESMLSLSAGVWVTPRYSILLFSIVEIKSGYR
jgi:hypothetical protein